MPVNDLLLALTRTENALTEHIIRATPSTEEEAAELRRLARLRDRVDGTISRIGELKIKAAILDLTANAQEVKALAEKIDGMAKTMATVKAAIGFVDQILGIVAEVVKLILAVA